MPILAVLGILALALAGAVIAGADSSATPPRNELLGRDGGFQEANTDDGVVQREVAHLRGGGLLASGPWWLALLKEDLYQVAQSSWLRVTTTSWRDGYAFQDLAVYENGDAGAALTLDQTSGRVEIYRPGRLDVPHDLAIGARWSGSGEVDRYEGDEATTTPFTYTAQASQPAEPDLAEAGCIEVETVQQRDGARQETLSQVWCPRVGPVLAGAGGQEPEAISAELLRPSGEAPSPSEWEPTTTAIDLDPPQVWSNTRPPVALADGMVIPNSLSADLIFVPEDDPALATRVHPGGSITMLQEVGEVVVVATSQAELLAYDPSGRRRWAASLADLATDPAARVGDTVAVTDASGTLTSLEATTGRTRWSTRLNASVTAPPIECRGEVVVGTNAGDVVTISDDGSVRWRTRLEARPTLLACVPGGVVAVTPTRLELLTTSGDRARSVLSQDGSITSAHVLESTLVTVSGGRVTGYDAVAIRRQWRRESACAAAVISHDVVVCRTETAVEVVGADGEGVAAWPLPPDPPGAFGGMTTTDDGVLLLSAPLTVTRIE